ncbi:hypothetical protein J7297_03049 [Nakaseomyces glabratus]|nr:hypothetical protein J7297_03049 [Nakaseomyces glabratus]KAH7588079.1 hypothetical protein J7296_02850 [Nakaseomyces glabratus]KAI8395160.1 hypothetical protein J6895_02881 [Nakaseomyces glabratus]KAJ9569163.1 hypothetical protein LTX96_0004437 [Nakaseomyces glabratus]OXB41903.1 hypothetical protein B1J91_J00968g [Nakaseomyces glabratus]
MSKLVVDIGQINNKINKRYRVIGRVEELVSGSAGYISIIVLRNAPELSSEDGKLRVSVGDACYSRVATAIGELCQGSAVDAMILSFMNETGEVAYELLDLRLVSVGEVEALRQFWASEDRELLG